MSFHETPVFPETASFHGHGGPVYNTVITTTEGGWEYGNQTAFGPRRHYVISFDARRAVDFVALPPFFIAVGVGRLDYFRYRDWMDYKNDDNGGSGVFVATGVANQFQVTKLYAAGAATRYRAIKKPRAGLVITGGVAPVLDTTTGLVTVSSGVPTSWTGLFDVPCRMDVDAMDAEILDGPTGARILGWQSIAIVEVRV